MIRHGDHHGVDVRPRHHLLVVVIRFAILVLVVPIDGVHRRREMFFVNVTRRDHLAVRFSHEIAGIARALHAPADDAHGDAFRGSRAAIRSQRAGGDDGRCRHGGGGGGNKAAAGNLGIDGFHGPVLCPTRHPCASENLVQFELPRSVHGSFWDKLRERATIGSDRPESCEQGLVLYARCWPRAAHPANLARARAVDGSSGLAGGMTGD